MKKKSVSCEISDHQSRPSNRNPKRSRYYEDLIAKLLNRRTIDFLRREILTLK